MNSKIYCKQLVLDAGPLLSLSPLKGIAESYYTVPQVLAELKDKNAKEHLERLGLNFGIKIEIGTPDAASMAQVTQWAKKTGDYSVLSHADLSVLALTHMLHEQGKKEPPTEALESLKIEKEEQPEPEPEPKLESEPEPKVAIYDDPSDSDDGEGEWITPANVALHKSRALDLLPNQAKGKQKEEFIAVGCMTADFAMQNVLMQMGLNLVGTEGKRIQRVKTWVLRCHACFKICKDSSKQFCPSCGNPSLLRASVTIASPDASSDAPAMQVHLKPNFQYKLRGTKYSIPAPKPGSAKHGPGEGLILREDQMEYMRARKRLEGKQERDEARMMKGLLEKGDGGVAVGSWMDPDWMPEIMSASTGGKGRTPRGDGMPAIGYGRKNPNERRRKK